IFASLGALLTWSQDIRNNASWLGHHYQPAQLITVTLQEDPIEKKKSYKALASARWIKHGDSLKQISGDIIIYCQKDAAIQEYKYGPQLVIKKNLQPMQHAANPGGFDYKRFSLLRHMTHQVYLKQDELLILPKTDSRWIKQFLIRTR